MLAITQAPRIPGAIFICECEEDVRSSCADEPYYGSFEGRRYCVLHLPDEKKCADFGKALQKKIKANDFNFSGVWFPDEANFASVVFNTKVNFFKAVFTGTANFSSASFNGANFRESKFLGDAYFDYTTFYAPAAFSHAIFEAKTYFSRTTFNKDAQAYFADAVFNAEVDFRIATFDSLADFGHVIFMRANFDKTSFNDQSVFSYAIFNEEVSFFRTSFMKESEFRNTKFNAYVTFSFAAFEAAEFRDAIFSETEEANFSHAVFSTNASFSYTQFGAEAMFRSAIFKSQVYFSQVTFKAKADFSYALFEDYAIFAGDKKTHEFDGKACLDFQHSRIEKPDHFSFVSLTLRPHWFLHVDTRKLDFTDVYWEGSISSEIEELKKKKVSSPDLLLAVICRQLAINAEDNHRYETASRFRYWAMELQRNVRWRDFEFWEGLKKIISTRLKRFSQHQLITPFRRDWLYWLYWAAIGYGERVLRGILVLIGIWLLFAWLYTQVGFIRTELNPIMGSNVALEKDNIGEPLRFTRALSYSLGVMSLQRPDPRPLTNTAHTLMTLQTILGPLQAALLALAIRRKFMR